MAFNLHDLQVKGIMLSEVLSCEIEGTYGEHSRVTIHGYVEEQETILYELPNYSPIEVHLKSDTGNEILFAGILTNIRFYTSAETQVVEIEGKSSSWLMDLTKKSRSFQDTQMSYQTLFEQILIAYPGSIHLYHAPQMPIGKLIVQYEETDWEFLIRVASMIGMTITPDSQQAIVKLHVGIPPLPESEISHQILNMEKDLGTYYYLKENGRSVFASDFTKYEIQSEHLLRLFDKVSVKGQSLTIFSYRYDFVGQEMMAYYHLQMERGLSKATQYPMHLIGVALLGRTVNISGDKVQVALNIDQQTEGKAVYWFPYSTISASPNGSGWYCMPEMGDVVRVYFPSKDEKEAIALSAVSDYSVPKGGQADRMQDPNSRYLRTKHGQEVALAPGYLKISCGEGLSSVTIKDDGKITISAQKKVSVLAQKMIKIHAEDELKLCSKDNIILQSIKGGKIEALSGNIEFKGTEVKFD